jgi:hypothetical protein
VVVVVVVTCYGVSSGGGGGSHTRRYGVSLWCVVVVMVMWHYCHVVGDFCGNRIKIEVTAVMVV